MKGLLKLAMVSLCTVALVEILRHWRLSRSALVPTLHPLEDAEPTADEPLQPEDLRVAQNSPL